MTKSVDPRVDGAIPPFVGKTRRRWDWPTLLMDAKARGVSLSELADELGIWRGQVGNAARRFDIKLPRRLRGTWSTKARCADG